MHMYGTSMLLRGYLPEFLFAFNYFDSNCVYFYAQWFVPKNVPKMPPRAFVKEHYYETIQLNMH